MLKRLGITGGVVAIAAFAVGSVAPATGVADRGHDDDDGIIVRVLSTNTEEEFVDVGEPGPSLGDAFIFTSNLTRQGKAVGHTGVVCTFTSVVREEVQCVGTARLLGGQIAIQGLLAGEPDIFSFPITGGTGRYVGAEGTLWVKELSDTQEQLTFILSD